VDVGVRFEDGPPGLKVGHLVPAEKLHRRAP
jgi:hypothetical protein